MASRQLDALALPVYRAALAFIERCNVVGLHVLIYCTMRDDDEQAMLYARGRTEPGAIVTRLMPGNVRFGHFEFFHHSGRPGDARLLADVYIGMTRGQNSLLGEGGSGEETSTSARQNLSGFDLPILLASADELQAHQQVLSDIGKKATVVWA